MREEQVQRQALRGAALQGAGVLRGQAFALTILPPYASSHTYAQVERLHAAGERSGLATAVMEHAHAMISLATALYIRKEFDEAKVGACSRSRALSNDPSSGRAKLTALP